MSQRSGPFPAHQANVIAIVHLDVRRSPWTIDCCTTLHTVGPALQDGVLRLPPAGVGETDVPLVHPLPSCLGSKRAPEAAHTACLVVPWNTIQCSNAGCGAAPYAYTVWGHLPQACLLHAQYIAILCDAEPVRVPSIVVGSGVSISIGFCVLPVAIIDGGGADYRPISRHQITTGGP